MKKFLSLVLLYLIISAFPLTALAIHTPLSAPHWNASVDENSDVRLVSYNAHLNIDNGNTYVKTRSVIRNPSDDNKEVLIGVPQQIDNGNVTINDLEVFVNGIKQTLSTRNNETNPDSTNIKGLPARWLAFTVNLKPGESKIIESVFSFNIILNEGRADIYIPLDFLEPWNGSVSNMEITAESISFPNGILEGNPTIMPTHVGFNGEISWSFSDINTPQPIKFKFNNLVDIIAEHLRTNAEDTNKVNEIINHYYSMEYDTVISLINDYNKEYPDTIVDFELYLLQAISYKAIHKMENAMLIYENMLNNPVSLSKIDIFKNTVLYELFVNNYSRGDSKTLNDFLIKVEPYISGNDSLSLFLQNEINKLPEPEPPTPEETLKPTPAPTEDSTSEDDGLVKFVTIYGVKIPVEFIFLGVFVLVVLILLYTRRRKKKNKYYLFRY